MKRPMHKIVAISLACLALVACAQVSPSVNLPAAALPARERALSGERMPTPIYDNLGHGKHVYDCCIAWTVGGPQSAIGKQWIAAPFTPTATRFATVVRIALTWSIRANGHLQAAIARDRRGYPGADLAVVAIASDLPEFNSCCKLQTLHLARRVQLRAHTRYWLIVRTQKAAAKSVGNWQNNTTGAGGEVSGNTGAGWVNTKVTKGMPAFAVLGV